MAVYQTAIGINVMFGVKFNQFYGCRVGFQTTSEHYLSLIFQRKYYTICSCTVEHLSSCCLRKDNRLKKRTCILNKSRSKL